MNWRGSLEDPCNLPPPGVPGSPCPAMGRPFTMDSLEKAVRTVFLNDERELRSGWRVCVFVACLVALTLILRGMVAMAAVFLPGLRTITEAPPDVQSPAHTILEFFLDSGVN